MSATEINTNNTNDRIAVLAGGGSMPYRVAQSVKHPLIIGIKGQIDLHLFSEFNVEEVHMGQIGKLLTILKSNKINKLCLIGKLNRPSLFDLRLDWKGLKVFVKYGFNNALSKYGDDRLLKLVKLVLDNEDIKLIGAYELCPDLLLPSGNLTKKKPDAHNMKDIEIGLNAAKEHGRKDQGQAVIVQNKMIIDVEDKYGTDAMLKRVSEENEKFKRDSAILVKSIKPQQDLGLDMPALGLETIKNIHQYGYKGIAAVSGKTLVNDLDEMIEYANDHNLFIYGIEDI